MPKPKTAKKDFDNPGAAHRHAYQKRSEGYNAYARQVRGKGVRVFWSWGFVKERNAVAV